jgi:endonuclease/exonuclease/phosphatase family metal-dependent hydrolase
MSEEGPRVLSRRSALVLGGAAVATAATAMSAPHARAATEHRIDTITYNVGNRSDAAVADDLRRLMNRSERTAVIGLQEVSDRVSVVSSTAREHGFRAVWAEDGEHRRHNTILLRRDLEIAASGCAKLHGPLPVNPNTPGSADGTVVPKWINWVAFRVDGLAWVVGVVHFVPSAAQFDSNRRVFQTEVDGCVDWWHSRVREPLLMGDFNATPSSPLLADLRAIAEPRSEPSHGDRAIDMVWSKKSATGAVNALNGFSSDHRPVAVTVTVNR